MGVRYVVEASGTVYISQTDLADAEFSGPNWSEVTSCCDATETKDLLDVVVNGAAINWLGSQDGGLTWQPHTFSFDHVYRTYLVGSGVPVSFVFADWTPLGDVEAHGDNSG